MKKQFLAVMLISMTMIFLGSIVCVKAQTSKTTATTVVTKENSSATKPCCKSGTTSACDKSKCDKSKCGKTKGCSSEGKCTHSGTSCANSSGCKMANTSNKTSIQRKSCCEAMKNKNCKMKSTEKAE